MTAIWGSGADGQWRALEPTAYQAEAELHDLVEKAPQMLPLAGSPQLREQIEAGTGSADIARSWETPVRAFCAIRDRFLLY